MREMRMREARFKVFLPPSKSKNPLLAEAKRGRVKTARTYCTFSAKSSTTNDVCADVSSVPTRYT